MKDNNIINSYHDELTKLEKKEKKKIEKFKKKEEVKKRRQEKRLEKIEDKIFAKRQKLVKEENLIKEEKIPIFCLTNIYKVSLIITLFLGICYFVYSLIKQVNIFNVILFTSIIIGFTLTSAIQKKKERKIISIITSILFIIWILVNM